ncbi:MAG: hypothetical protein Q9220_000447 [cf. Caloplaca sp. 1 TL-2023]
MNNGGSAMMEEIRDHGPHLLPDTNGQIPLKKTYTGFAAIDYQLTVLTLFFYKIVDGSHPGASLQAYHFCGQLIAGYGLLVLESLRQGNQWKIVSFITIWGLSLQNAAMAVLIPLYFALHLSTSPTVSSRKQCDLLPDSFRLSYLPFSITIGLILPSVLVALPAPTVLTYESKQVCMAIWQMFPLWVGLLQGMMPLISSYISGAPGPENGSERTIDHMRTIYAMLMTVAMVSRISTCTIAFSAILFPSLFAPRVAHLLTPMAVFVPRAATPSVKVPSIAAGAFQFLQYDEMVGESATVVWSAALCVSGTGRKSFSGWMKSIAIGILIASLAGPQGFAIAAVWARDETFFAQGDSQQYKNKKEKAVSH